jgi:hypothetical protein
VRDRTVGRRKRSLVYLSPSVHFVWPWWSMTVVIVLASATLVMLIFWSIPYTPVGSVGSGSRLTFAVGCVLGLLVYYYGIYAKRRKDSADDSTV